MYYYCSEIPLRHSVQQVYSCDVIIIPPVSLFVLCVGIFFAYPIIYLHQFEEQVIFRALDLEALDGGAPVSPIAHLLRGSTWS